MSLFGSFLSNLIVCILQEREKCRIYAKIIKNSRSLKTIELEFDVENGKISPKFNKQIRALANSVHSTYLAVLLFDAKQCAMPASSDSEFRRFGVRVNESKIVKMPESWSIILPRDVLVGLEPFLNGADVDLAYSPFALLYERIRGLNLKHTGPVIYIYVQKSCSSMLIFEKKKMKFAAYFNSDGAKARRSEYALNAFDTHDLDSIINAEEDKINALDSLGDLGDIDTDTEFADIQGESDEPQSEESIEKSIQGIGKTMSVVGNMKTALDDFYKSEEGGFVNLAVIFDACGLIDEHFPDVVHSELAIDSKIYSANAGEEMISIIKREIKL